MGSLVAILLLLSVGEPFPAVGSAPECRPLPDPKRLPSLGSLVDSAGLISILPSSFDTAGTQLGLTFANGGLAAVFAIEPSDSAKAFAQRVEGLVMARGAPAGTNLRIRVRSPTDITVERSILCPPVPLDSLSPKRVMFVVGRVSEEDMRLQTGKQVVRIHIGIDGHIIEARLQPGTGRADLDQQVLGPVYERRWLPARLDGRPVAVWLANGRVELVR